MIKIFCKENHWKISENKILFRTRSEPLKEKRTENFNVFSFKNNTRNSLSFTCLEAPFFMKF